jgi:hypothetical protein
MASKRASLWNQAHRERYLSETKDAATRAAARREGVHTAEVIDSVWSGLGADERSLIEYLLIVGSPTLVALYDDGFLDRLVAKGLLRKPVGVGTLLMNELETTYDVPEAVWKALNDRKAEFLPHAAAEAEQRRRRLSRQFAARILIVERKAAPNAERAGTQG